MPRIAEVRKIERVDEDGAKGTNLVVDEGGNPITVEHFTAAGVDSCPMVGDFVALDDARETALGYADIKNEDASEPGEFRAYARKADGSIVGQVFLKVDGSMVLESMEGGTTVTLKPNGDIEIKPGNQVKIGANPISALALAQKVDQRIGDLETAFNNFLSGTFVPHTHPDAMGSTGPTPTPATPLTPGQSTASEIAFSE